jgi:prophage regulatory protein
MKATAMKLIPVKTVLDRTGLSRSVFYDLMGKGAFPMPTKAHAGGRSNFWLESEIDAYIEARLAERGKIAPHLVEQMNNLLAARHPQHF